MTNTINGLDLTFVNISNQALADKREMAEAREAGIRAVIRGRQRSEWHRKARKWDRFKMFMGLMCVIACEFLLMMDWG